MVLSSSPWGVWGNVLPYELFLMISGMRQFDGMYLEWRLMWKLFHEAGCRLVHRYQIYKDPLPHPALRAGCFGGFSDLLIGLSLSLC